ncbi:hypothetical protein EDC04DRAFT_1031326 [Pisolithus marmoratus]|nr:hypothetical protein EDC04DRAFT_1031326 [Pisolithus marmoratus]
MKHSFLSFLLHYVLADKRKVTSGRRRAPIQFCERPTVLTLSYPQSSAVCRSAHHVDLAGSAGVELTPALSQQISQQTVKLKCCLYSLMTLTVPNCTMGFLMKYQQRTSLVTDTSFL